ncbi:ankyrin repeat domain-containing protein [Coprobacter tertius]|uniref:Ankyrin repeat domain-containing protein n=1 Tax=Coprobacter tertius TaxID=2944915 RepID=A0ABT1MH80_9BACT|nr:ankyrin repeat domain-containing protein [Coprobacter tertius]MCP9611975.1 ankyrin repeat domain-containing protein [Coprobacter tertius]
MKKNILCCLIILQVVYSYGINNDNKNGRKLTAAEFAKIDSLLTHIPNNECADTLYHLLSQGIDTPLATTWIFPVGDVPVEEYETIEINEEKRELFIRFYEGTTPIMIAARLEFVPLTKELISLGADMKACVWVSEYGEMNNIVDMAMKTYSEEFISDLIDWSLPVTGPEFFTDRFDLLTDALYRRQFYLFDKLIRLGADINHVEKGRLEFYPTLLCKATFSPNLELMKILIEKGADVNCGSIKMRPINVASKIYDEKYIRFLLDHGAKPYFNGNTDIRNLKALEILLDSGVDINAVDKSHCSFLWHAVKNNLLPLVSYLIDHGANMNIPDKKGIYPIDMAKKDCYDLLLKAGATDNKTKRMEAFILSAIDMYREEMGIEIIKNLISGSINNQLCNDTILEDEFHTKLYAWSSPLLISTTLGYENIVTALISNKADLNLCDRLGNYPLLKATESGNYNLVKILLSAGSDTDGKNRFDMTPLRIACRKKRYDILDLLLDHKADIRSYTFNPLIDAIENEDIKAITKLIAHDANIETYDNKGRTSLLVAIEKGNRDIVKLLLDTGADTTVTDDNDRSVWDYAKGKPDIMNLLLIH